MPDHEENHTFLGGRKRAAKIYKSSMNKMQGTVIWLGNLEWCLRILKRKSRFFSEVCFFSCSAGNVGDFCSFKGYGAGPTGLQFKNS